MKRKTTRRKKLAARLQRPKLQEKRPSSEPRRPPRAWRPRRRGHCPQYLNKGRRRAPRCYRRTFPPPTKGPVADVQRERLKAKERVAKHRRKVEAEREAKELADDQRKRQYAHVDLDQLREEAARRAKDAAAKNAMAAAKIAAALKAKKEAAAAKGRRDARARANGGGRSIRALNRIMRDSFSGFRGRGLVLFYFGVASAALLWS